MKDLKFGFTLSEVLITLGVVGVIAAITIPTLIQHHQKQTTVLQLKKAYTEFAQALQKAEAENGMMETWDFAYFNNDSRARSKYFGENYIFPHIKTIKKCIPTSNECWADNVTSLSNIISSSINNSNTNKCISFITSSGYSVFLWLHSSGMGMFYVVDVNGLKKPNRLGRDIFILNANWGKTTGKRGVYPNLLTTDNMPNRNDILEGKNLSNNGYACKKGNSNYNGYGCAAVIMLDGWKIEKDYPW